MPKAVQDYCEEFSASVRHSGVVRGRSTVVDDLSRGAALALFRIVQEALGNAAKHAQATRITVRLTRSRRPGVARSSPTTAWVSIAASLSPSGGLGLIMMRERAAQLNGTVRVRYRARTRHDHQGGDSVSLSRRHDGGAVGTPSFAAIVTRPASESACILRIS